MNLLLIRLIAENIKQISVLCGARWPYYREILISCQSRITSAENEQEINGYINELVNLLIETEARELIISLIAQAELQTEQGQSRSVDQQELITDNQTTVVSSGAVLVDQILSIQEEGFVSVPVFYATDRDKEGNTYSGKRGKLTYGKATVSIPNTHTKGKFEEPKWWKFEFRDNPDKHISLLQFYEIVEQDFVLNIGSSISHSSEQSVLLFVHGFNVTFEEAVRRTAQLVYDLEYQGVAMTYSWPSAGALWKYTVDESSVDWTVPHLQQVLSSLNSIPKLEAVDVIAHSMGNRALLNSIRSSWQNTATSIPAQFRQVVLAAPDIDAGVFRNICTELNGRAQRITLYASSRDRALKFSKAIHGYARAGESGPNIVVLGTGVDTVDATDVDTNLIGHSYYGDNRSILTDLFVLLRYGGAPPRFGMTTKSIEHASYWVFRP